MVHLFLREHLTYLSRHGEVTLLVNAGTEPHLDLNDLPVRIVQLGIERNIAPTADLLSLWQLGVFLRREKFDLVWAAGPKAGLLGMVAAWLTRVPRRMFIFQGEVWAASSGRRRWLLKTLDRVTARLATHLLAVSSSEKAFLEQENVVRPGRMQVLGDGSIGGVDTLTFCPDPHQRALLRRQYDIPQDATVLLYLGRLNPDKGIEDLARSFLQARQRHPGLWLLMVGPDEFGMMEKVRAILGEPGMDSRYTMPGFTSDAAPWFQSADIFCLPSYREGFPVSLLEAAAVGIPSIGSDIYGIRGALVDGQTGLLFPARDVARLTDTIITMAEDTALRQHLGAGARTRVLADYECSAVLARYEKYFTDLLDQEAAPTP